MRLARKQLRDFVQGVGATAGPPKQRAEAIRLFIGLTTRGLLAEFPQQASHLANLDDALAGDSVETLESLALKIAELRNRLRADSVRGLTVH